jgi:predicted DNA-binding transcriptional regulator AlpA
MFIYRKPVRERLLPEREREEMVRQYGEMIRPMLEELLDAKAEELAARYEGAWDKWFANLNASVVRENEDLLVTRDKAAKMLGISLSSIKRLEERGELPKPRKFGERTVRHRLTDILAFARTMPTRS